MELGAALANDDAAGATGFATVSLDATILGVAIATVPGRALTFLMSHGCRSAQPEMEVISISVYRWR